jgi:hypothetical protein
MKKALKRTPPKSERRSPHSMSDSEYLKKIFDDAKKSPDKGPIKEMILYGDHMPYSEKMRKNKRAKA